MFPIKSISTSTFTIPCDTPESDGSLEWSSTTLIVVLIESNSKQGLGYTYGHSSIANLIKDVLAPLLLEEDGMNTPLLWHKMIVEVRNFGHPGLCAQAIAAVDIALWDLKAKYLELPLCHLFGMAQKKIPVYGSGGFTSYTDTQLEDQFRKWQAEGITKFKMKVGRHPEQDYHRVKKAREVIGDKAELFVDANGAYTCKQALDLAEKFRGFGVSWFEEPVSSDDLEGLYFLRTHTKMNIAAGEYGYTPFYFKNMLEAEAVDVLQADATRCCGYTGFMQAAHLSYAFNIPLSSHTAPSIHLPIALSIPHLCHMEYFHDHVEIEKYFFEGFPKLENGYLYPSLDRPGHGLELNKAMR